MHSMRVFTTISLRSALADFAPISSLHLGGLLGLGYP